MSFRLFFVMPFEYMANAGGASMVEEGLQYSPLQLWLGIAIFALIAYCFISIRQARLRYERLRALLYRRLPGLLISGEPLEVSLENVFRDFADSLQIQASQIWVCRKVHEVLNAKDRVKELEVCSHSSMPDGKEHLTLALVYPLSSADTGVFGKGAKFLSVRVRGEILVVLCLQNRRSSYLWGGERRFLESLAETIAILMLYSARRSVEREVRLKSTAMDSASEGIAVLDSKQRLLYCNNALEQLLQKKQLRFPKGEHWSALLSDDEYERVQSAYAEVAGSIDRFSVETALQQEGQVKLPVRLTLTDLGTDGFVCTIRDISFRKKVEESAEQVALFSTLNPSPVFRTDPDGKLLMANPAALSLFPRDEDPHIALLGRMSPDFSLDALVRKEGVETTVFDVGDRSYQFVVRGVSHLNAAQFYGTDVTDLRKKGEELLESKAFLRTIIDTDPNLIFVKDREGRFQLGNKALADAYGSTVEEIVGKTDAYFNGDSSEVENFRTDDLEVIDKLEEKCIPEEIVTDARGEQRYLQTVKRPLVDKKTGDVHVLGVATDITELKMLQSQLMHTDKMEAIGRLAGGIAHDFNNILTGILGYTSLLKLSAEQTVETEKATDFIESAARRAAELTSKLLGFARKGKHRNLAVDLHDAIDEALGLLSRTLETDIRIERKLDAKQSAILGDPTQVQQILLNLAINARDSMVSGEVSKTNRVLSISTANLSSAELPESVPASSASYVELRVADTGCGMEPAVQERIFDPFFTTKAEGEGTGMGLSMVYGIIQSHGGAITVQSKKGEGAVFSLYFPVLLEQRREDSKKLVEQLSDPVAEKLEGFSQILLVDDHSDIRHVTSKMLSTLGYQVTTASDGYEALEYYRENQDRVDLVILDMVMPNMGAQECFEEIKRINPAVRAVLSTGYVNNNKVQEILNQGMAGFVQKPYQIQQLSDVVQKALKP